MGIEVGFVILNRVFKVKDASSLKCQQLSGKSNKYTKSTTLFKDDIFLKAQAYLEGKSVISKSINDYFNTCIYVTERYSSYLFYIQGGCLKKGWYCFNDKIYYYVCK